MEVLESWELYCINGLGQIVIYLSCNLHIKTSRGAVSQGNGSVSKFVMADKKVIELASSLTYSMTFMKLENAYTHKFFDSLDR